MSDYALILEQIADSLQHDFHWVSRPKKLRAAAFELRRLESENTRLRRQTTLITPSAAINNLANALKPNAMVEMADAAVAEMRAERDAAIAENAELSDKALRFDLHRAGIASAEADAVELVELRAENAELKARNGRLMEFARRAARYSCGCNHGDLEQGLGGCPACEARAVIKEASDG